MGKRASSSRFSSRFSSRLPLFSIRLSDLTKSRWREAAEREGRTLAGYIKHAVERYIEMSGEDNRIASAPAATVWLCAKCGYGSQEHGMPGHPAYLCVADMREVPIADMAR